MLTAQKIVDYAKSAGITLKRMHVVYPTMCALGTLAHQHGTYDEQDISGEVCAYYDREQLADILGISHYDINHIEYGFEGFESIANKTNPYYQLGQEVARAAGYAN